MQKKDMREKSQILKTCRTSKTCKAETPLVMLATSNVMERSGVRPSVCPVGILTVSRQGAACDAASVHFGRTISGTDILVRFVVDVLYK